MEIVSQTELVSINATMLVQVMSFLIFLVIITRIMFKPLRRTMEDRSVHIKQLQHEMVLQEKKLNDISAALAKEEKSLKAEAFLESEQRESSAKEEAQVLLGRRARNHDAAAKSHGRDPGTNRGRPGAAGERDRTPDSDDHGKNPRPGGATVRLLLATLRLPAVSIILIGGLHLMAGSCWADEGGSTWRSTYDEVMLWLNFGILAFLLVKYGRAPLIAFLRGEAKRTAEEIERVEESKRRADEKVQEMVSAD